VGGEFHVLGTDGGFLPAPVQLDELLIGPAERFDVIVDLSGYAAGTELYLVNIGPDEPFGGGVPGADFDPADPASTGQVMKLVVTPRRDRRPDRSTPPERLALPGRPQLTPTLTRQVSLNEADSEVLADVGPRAALLGTVDLTDPSMPMGEPLHWMDGISEHPEVGATEVWEIYNFTMDAHPIHLHLVQFQVLGREPFMGGGTSVAGSNLPLAWESGEKDTVIAYPGEITRLQARFDLRGLYVWHCHIIDHEDNEMMRPYFVGDSDGYPDHLFAPPMVMAP